MNVLSWSLQRVSQTGLALAVAAVVSLPLVTQLSAGSALAPSDDFVTGGGWITGTPTGARANFGVKGGVDVDGSFFGHLNYVDHETNLHVKAESVTNYVIVNATTRRIDGTATIDGVSGFTFTVTVSDAGEPGTADTFAISLSSGYTATGTLQGGNIQLHVDV